MKKIYFYGIICFFFLCLPAIGDDKASGTGALTLEEIVVTGTKSQHTLEDTPVTTYLVTKEEIEKSNAKTAGDALKWIPGVYIKSNGFARQSVNINGLPNEYTLVLIDGIRQTGRHANAVDLANIPSDMIERIEVIKGPSALLYGSDAVAGVVNVITRKVPEKRYVAGKGSYGTGDAVETQFNFGETLGKFSYTLGAGHQSSNHMGDGYEYDADNAVGNFQYQINQDNSLSLNLNIYNENSDYLDDTKFNGTIGIDTKFSETSNLKLNISEHFATRRDIRPNQSPRDWDYDNRQALLQYNQMFGDIQLVTIGAEYRQNNLESTEVGDQDENIVSSFLQDEIELFNSSLVLVIGGRIDHHDQWGTEFNPKGSLLYMINPETKVRLNAGRAFLAPQLDDLYKLHPHHHVSYWIVGNPDIEPETSVGYSIDLEHVWANSLLGRISFFRNDIDNMISSREIGTYETGESIMQSYNIDEACAQGFELEAQYAPIKSLFMSAAYTYSETEDKAVKKQIRNMPKHTGKLRLRYDNESYGYTVSSELEYIGKMYTDKALTTESDDFFLLNFKVTKTLSDHINMFAGVDNVFDEVTAPETSRYFDMGVSYTGGVSFRF
ncbi:putative TonB-dependent receptor [Desulfamplus magnetovallimortis]|uniref:Putative TonB-dependent receptor n=1 Tax=Desulfamplus magnetovallimortis TaxID=1246637 RepID=A0A1W1HB36_9BACT|nr:TonB-dependent receptor [Desulfamplus magnetovallimortis]SLM29690.1 putative TonB-dependent receptor [Desulfamplus magnetovallimortis]